MIDTSEAVTKSNKFIEFLVDFEIIMRAFQNFGGLLFIATAVLTSYTLGQECASGVDTCVNTAFGIITANANNRDVICNTTDEFLACIVEETKTCDFVVAASIKEGVSPMIDMYTAPPYNCVLENGNDAAVRADPCSEQLNRCAIFYTQADTETRPALACSTFERYLDCMKIDTSQCDDQLANDIKDHSLNATLRFDNSPYFCEERLMYDIDEVDKGISQCYQILSDMNLSILKQDYICGVYQNFINCTASILTKASPRQFAVYAASVDRDVASFRSMPFFCDAEEPCMTLFQSCNSSAYSPIIKPCELLGVYTSCLTRSLISCDEKSYARLAQVVLTLEGEIHNTHNCGIESNNENTDSSSNTNNGSEKEAGQSQSTLEKNGAKITNDGYAALLLSLAAIIISTRSSLVG